MKQVIRLTHVTALLSLLAGASLLLACGDDVRTAPADGASAALGASDGTTVRVHVAPPVGGSGSDALGPLGDLCAKSAPAVPDAPPGCIACFCATTARCGAPCRDIVSCTLEHCADQLSDADRLRECTALHCERQLTDAAKTSLPGLSLLHRCQSFCAKDTAPVDTPAVPPAAGAPAKAPEAGRGGKMP